MEINVKAPKVNAETTVVFDIPESVEDLVEAFGAEYVAAAAISHTKIALQGFVRSLLEAGESDIQKEVDNWNPTVKRRGGGGGTSIKSLIAKIASADDATKLAILEQFRAAGLPI